ncbi:hypothetical protein GCM10010441_46770 [Kitasatospora paracochleata]|uniref:Uncharacterized protein n=1 Tax=Kitasatospora paracochleata TaxID=58354 RepID=A0ABT1J642_9ACTN|nr:hypothetical protein [Kitasatospora paracochleata]MCP2312907.1 hypothetical protein [Kitasatospora paracochleata]
MNSAVLTWGPLALTPEGAALVAEIEAYLATLPATARPTQPVRDLYRFGSTVQPWHAGFPEPRPTLLDRIAHRPARPVPVTVADHLTLASRYMTAFGWTQGRLWDDQGRVCLLGAQAAVLAHGYGTPTTVVRARIQVMEVLHTTGRPVPSPDAYNDAPTTRQTDIHHLLDWASARALSLGI